MLIPITWPKLIPQFRSDPLVIQQLAANLYAVSQQLTSEVQHITQANASLGTSCHGKIITALQKNLHSLKLASEKLSDNLLLASQAAQKYADTVRILSISQAKLQAQHKQLSLQAINLSSSSNFLTRPIKLIEYRYHMTQYNNAISDHLYEIQSAEAGFINALGLQHFPQVQTGEYTDTTTVAQKDAANRQRLAQDIITLSNLPHPTPVQIRALKNAQEIQRQLDYIDQTLNLTNHKTAHQEHMTQLYSYDLQEFHGDGKVLIGIGDLDHAHNIAISIPGITAQVSSAQTTVYDALQLYTEIYRQNSQANFAGMVCIGYDAPSGTHLPSETVTASKARAGALELAQEIDEYAALRYYEGTGQDVDPLQDQLHLTLIGHSYGSTTTAYAGLQGRLAGEIDDVILIGSPGVGPMHHAAEFGIGADHVHLGKDPDDLVASIASNVHGRRDNDFNYLHYLGKLSQEFGLGLGNDPYNPQFNAHIFDAHNSTKLFLHKFIGAHLGYYQPGSSSLDNMINIVAGTQNSITENSIAQDSTSQHSTAQKPLPIVPHQK